MDLGFVEIAVYLCCACYLYNRHGLPPVPSRFSFLRSLVILKRKTETTARNSVARFQIYLDKKGHDP